MAHIITEMYRYEIRWQAEIQLIRVYLYSCDQNYNMIFIYSFILNQTTIGSIHTHKTQRQTRTNTNRIGEKFTLEKTK